MTLDLSHLPIAVRERAFDSNQDRIRQVKVANWVGYTRANRALERLDEMIEQPSCARMPCPQNRYSDRTSRVVSASFGVKRASEVAGAPPVIAGTTHVRSRLECAARSHVPELTPATTAVAGFDPSAQLRGLCGFDSSRNRSCNFDQRRSTCWPFTAMASARFCPTNTTSRLPRVMPV